MQINESFNCGLLLIESEHSKLKLKKNKQPLQLCDIRESHLQSPIFYLNFNFQILDLPRVNCSSMTSSEMYLLSIFGLYNIIHTSMHYPFFLMKPE